MEDRVKWVLWFGMVTLTLGVLCPAGHTQAPRDPGKTVGLWHRIRVDIFDYPAQPYDRSRYVESGNLLSFAFVDNQTLSIVMSQSRQRVREDPRQPLHDEQDRQVRIAFLDAESGKLRGMATWPGPPFPTQVCVVSNGRIVAVTGALIGVYTAHFATISGRTLENKPTAIVASPSGNTLLVTYLEGSSRRLEVLDVDTLETKDEWRETNRWVTFALSDHGVVSSGTTRGDFRLKRFGFPWMKLDEKVFRKCGGHATPLTDATLVLPNCGERRLVVTVAGEMLFEEVARKKEWFRDTAYPSPDGNRFVGYLSKEHGLNLPSWDIYPDIKRERLVVYDTVSRSAIFSLPTQPLTEIGSIYTAFSPNGSLLAIYTSERELLVYRLPKTNAVP